VLEAPPPIVDTTPVALFAEPPPTKEQAPNALIEIPPDAVA
jgi:hypothetical protein